MTVFTGIFSNSEKYNIPNIISVITFLHSKQRTEISLNFETNTIDTTIDLKVVKTNDAFDTLVRVPFEFNRISIQPSAVSYKTLKYVLYSDCSSQIYQVSSKEVVQIPLDKDDTGMMKLTVSENTKQLFVFKFIRDKESLQDRRASQSNPFPIPMADGPLFREAINTYEQLIPLILKRIHSSLEKKVSSDSAFRGPDLSKLQMLDALKDFKKGIMPSFRGDSLYSNFNPRSNPSNSLVFKFLTALQTKTALPDVELKTFNMLQSFGPKKKAFEDDSKRYYDWLSKLMSSGKSKDEKLLHKMKGFEISKMQYFNYLFDVITPLLLELVELGDRSSEEYWRNKSERLLAVEQIKNCTSLDSFTDKMKVYSKLEPQETSLLLIDPKSPYKIESFKNTITKSGLLFVYGGQGKSGWHKQWLVLYNGKLYEYMDWRKGATLRNAPLDVSLCNIKLLGLNEQRNTVDIGARKNCFRVINSQGIEHIFQSFTPSEAEEWVKALIKASKIVSYSKNRDPGYSTKHTMQTGDNHDRFSGSLSSALTRSRRVSSVSLSLLNVVRNNSSSNAVCADCGSIDNVEWISLNFLVTFCIQCCSAHRNLGSYVSKVRSLTLDSFAAESRSLLYHIDNQRSNSVYEAVAIVADKPKPDSDSKTRLSYIRDKYALKKYVSEDVKLAADKFLMEGLRNNDIGKVLTAIAGNVDLNHNLNISKVNEDDWTMKHAQITPLEYALLNPSLIDGSEVFETAELLVLNGCDAGTQVREGSLVDTKARKWWQDKINKIHYGETSKNCSNIIVKDSRKSISGGRPNASFIQTSKVKSRSPKDSFNFFKKKLKHHT
ncbi:hypothetical protein CANINC_002526 [Pichia inconspicua]|uniref:ADP-ribosylation factor GTPase-activating protein n=1 Tax=Pichia inconspicua TaxID=52247 RepID=A0A4V4NFP4_9ASCO|nr:hypothetical protein CANINC_002526 [[Candida] inconspicua]